MAFIHGKDTYISIAGTDISTFTNSSDFERVSDEHDVTTYGQDSHVFAGGLLSGKHSIGGVYDDGATGPAAIIEPLVGTIAAIVFRPEGVGGGKPSKSFNVLVKSYKESSPVADMVMWTAELTLSGDVTKVDQ